MARHLVGNQGGARSARGAVLLAWSLGLGSSVAACGGSANDEARTRADDGSAGATGSGERGRGNSDEDDTDAGPSEALPNGAQIASGCEQLCEAWADCDGAGGADCHDECTDWLEGSIALGCHAEAVALYECVVASGECPESAPCGAEEDAHGVCMAAGHAGPSSPAGGSPGGGTATGSNGGVATAPDEPAAAPAPDSSPDGPASEEPAAEVDATEHFGGEASTPKAILDAPELPQCSDFEVQEFSCGGTGTSLGGAQCTVECYDPDDRVWGGLCRDGVCRCQYDGITYCQCAHEGVSESGCNSCCPQLSDADLR